MPALPTSKVVVPAIASTSVSIGPTKQTKIMLNSAVSGKPAPLRLHIRGFTATELGKHERILALVEVAEAVPDQRGMRDGSRALEH